MYMASKLFTFTFTHAGCAASAAERAPAPAAAAAQCTMPTTSARVMKPYQHDTVKGQLCTTAAAGGPPPHGDPGTAMGFSGLRWHTVTLCVPVIHHVQLDRRPDTMVGWGFRLMTQVISNCAPSLAAESLRHLQRKASTNRALLPARLGSRHDCPPQHMRWERKLPQLLQAGGVLNDCIGAVIM